MGKLISQQAAIDTEKWFFNLNDKRTVGEVLKDLPSIDAVNRQEAIDKIKKRLFETAFNNVGIKQNIDETLVDVAENRLENWFDELPSAEPDIIRCEDCKHYIRHDKRCGYWNHGVKPTMWCSQAERLLIVKEMKDLIDKWETMRALQAINPVAKLMDGDIVIRISEVENVLEHMPSAEQDTLEKAVAVEAISDELLSRFDISATYAYEIAEKAMNRIEAMAKEIGKR